MKHTPEKWMRLQEAAPDLLAALKMLTDTASWHSNVNEGKSDLDGSKLRGALATARAAIARIEEVKP
jgi:hypothetical protein